MFHLSRASISYALVTLSISFLAGIGGFALARHNQSSNDYVNTVTDPTIQHLDIQATINYDSFTNMPADMLGGNFDSDITYYGLTDVSINLDGTPKKLEDAIRDGNISVEEIIAFARLDSKKGICTETAKSSNGLTKLTYHYPEFDLWAIYDVYETPSYGQHLIFDFGLCTPGRILDYLYIDDETGIPIDREDWGLTFEFVSATSYGVTLNYTQTGGQQIGDLIVEHYSLYTDEYNFVTRLEGINSIEQYRTIPIEQDTTSQITIDWTDIQGAVPSGEYIIRIYLRDIFDESQVHPLMQDFSDTLYYDVPLSIP